MDIWGTYVDGAVARGHVDDGHVDAVDFYDGPDSI
jgi:hypothetical protein